MSFRMTINDRLILEVDRDGLMQHTYSHGGSLKIRDGFNDSCQWVANKISVNELRDLRYMIDRAIAAAEEAITAHETAKRHF